MAFVVRIKEQQIARNEVRFVIWPAMVSPSEARIPYERFDLCDRDHEDPCDVSRQDHKEISQIRSETMSQFGVLTNRKRAVIALIHSIVFLGVAVHGFVSPRAGILHGPGSTGDFVLIAIYLVMASILMWLVGISRGLVERAYFALCAISATSGLLRTIFGDHLVPPAQYLRVLMLSSAVGIGILIVRSHSRSSASDETVPAPLEASQD